MGKPKKQKENKAAINERKRQEHNKVMEKQRHSKQELHATQDSTVFHTVKATSFRPKASAEIAQRKDIDSMSESELLVLREDIKKMLATKKMQRVFIKESNRTQAIGQGLIGQNMKLEKVKPQGKPVTQGKKYAPVMPNFKALPIIDGVKILPKMKRKPNLIKVDSDYQKPRFQSVKKNKAVDNTLFTRCQLLKGKK